MVGTCSGPLQTYLRSSAAFRRADERLQDRLSSTEFLSRFPADWLFVNVRYGCADFYGRPTTSTGTVPTREWKLDKRRNEFVASVTLDGSSWEIHDKEHKSRTHLEAHEIERQILVAVVSALAWIARLFELPDSELVALRSELGDLPGALTPNDVDKALAAQILDPTKGRKPANSKDSGETLYKFEAGRMQCIELKADKHKLTIRKGQVGKPLSEESRAALAGQTMDSLLRSELRSAAGLGFAPLPDDQWVDLEVKVCVVSNGTAEDQRRKNEIGALLRKELPLRGLGQWTGDSTGAGSYEIGVRVVNEQIARQAIPEILRKHGLQDDFTIEEL